MDDTTLSPDQVRDELVRRQVRLYHAIDLPDFETYCNEWALLSRQQLEVCGGIKVPFYTDSSDKEKQLHDRCFGNLTHFWKLFWQLPWGLPNAYGLVTLVFKTEVFASCSDVAVTTVGANTKDFDLQEHRLSEKVRLGLALTGDTPGEPKIMVEFSTSTNSLPFDLLERIIVQPVEVGGRSLVGAVDALVVKAAEGKPRPPVVEEPAADGRDAERERFRSCSSESTRAGAS
ncbi:MAG: hypothetical protein IPG04_16945 [Polyangiaceae bacterium]|nr:hypothetical protein [Polyangiaceae bacterium]